MPTASDKGPLIGLLILLAIVLGMGTLIWKVFYVDEPRSVASVAWMDTKLRAVNSAGATLWMYDFPKARRRSRELVLSSYGRQAGQSGPVRADLPAPGEGFWHRIWSLPRLPKLRDEILVAVEFEQPDTSARVLSFDHAGTQLWEVSYRDAIGPAGDRFPPDWTMKDWMVYSVAGQRKIAVLLNHRSEWPSVVALLDDSGSVLGRFVNAGRISSMALFTTSSRILLLLSGASSSRNAGMLALVDALKLTGSSPEEAGSVYQCADCPNGGPVKYFLFPRSEVGIASGARVNEADYQGNTHRRQISEGGETVRTTETALEPSPKAEYYFSYGFENLRQTSFDEDYWDVHRQLETEGKISHSKAQCPERDGPRLVRAWDAEKGWRELRPIGR